MVISIIMQIIRIISIAQDFNKILIIASRILCLLQTLCLGHIIDTSLQFGHHIILVLILSVCLEVDCLSTSVFRNAFGTFEEYTYM